MSFKTGMNTATMKHYIDFASASGFAYMLIDAGWAWAERKGPQDYAALADITQHRSRDRHARTASICKRKARRHLAMVALDFCGQVHGPGFSACSKNGALRVSRSTSWIATTSKWSTGIAASQSQPRSITC